MWLSHVTAEHSANGAEQEKIRTLKWRAPASKFASRLILMALWASSSDFITVVIFPFCHLGKTCLR